MAEHTPSEPPCRVCQGRKWIAPDVTQLTWFQQRYQWADISYGVNDCPGCVQIPPTGAAFSGADRLPPQITGDLK